MAYTEKEREYNKKYYAKNRERMIERSRKYRKENSEKVRESVKRYRKENPEKVKIWKKMDEKRHPDKKRERKMRWEKKNPKKVKGYCDNYRKNNREKTRKYSREYRRKNPLKTKEYNKKYWKEHPEKKREYNKKKISTSIGRLNNIMRKAIWLSLKGNKENGHWETLVGWTNEQGRNYLESLFTPEMSWENYGTYWEIDHIIPISKWEFNVPEDREFKQCWALCNLRPLKVSENRSKGNRITNLSLPFWKQTIQQKEGVYEQQIS